MIDEDRESDLRGCIEALYFGYRAFTALPDRILAAHGLNRAHHRILYFVHRQPDISVSELLAVLAISKQAVHRPLRDLEVRGLVEIKPDAQDKRVRRIVTTNEGAALEGRLTGEQMQLLERAFEGADDAAVRNWGDILRRLAEVDDEATDE
ncbi:MarR family winged helix-turn-helix transcriptional regulator [Cumulibacter soli]|uniref:MarR family winged helix-turn-helix transcriptional regulator n=1 Tax=Cumulibacter soli TaxID=2546344 RepID=UPI0010672C33|nr:helix-turn-helix domain-containing protein [Cumulibacter soli]